MTKDDFTFTCLSYAVLNSESFELLGGQTYVHKIKRAENEAVKNRNFSPLKMCLTYWLEYNYVAFKVIGDRLYSFHKFSSVMCFSKPV